MKKQTSIPNWLFSSNLPSEEKLVYVTLQYIAQHRQNDAALTDTKRNIVLKVQIMCSFEKSRYDTRPDDHFNRVAHYISMLRVYGVIEIDSDWQRTDNPSFAYGIEEIWTIRFIEPTGEALEKLRPHKEVQS